MANEMGDFSGKWETTTTATTPTLAPPGLDKAHPVGTGVGVAAGAATGAAVGTAGAGPVGALVGAAAGAMAGGLAGPGVPRGANPPRGDPSFGGRTLHRPPPAPH